VGDLPFPLLRGWPALAARFTPLTVTGNAIAPADIRTGRFMGTRAVGQYRLVESGTLDRIATVDEVARVVEVFTGPLGAFVSGQVLRVDGGGLGARPHRAG